MSLQNGRFAKSETHVAKRRLYVQASLKRRIFFSSLGKNIKAICLLPLVRKLVPVPLPSVWFGTGTTNIHKILKSTNHNLTQDKHQNYHLLRRHAIEPRHSNLPSATSRICHKLEKVCVDPSAGNRFLGPHNKLCHSRTSFNQNENTESSFRMTEFVKQSTNINSGIDKVDLLVDVSYSSSLNQQD